MGEVVALRGFLLIIGTLVLCIGIAALLPSVLAGSNESGTVDAPGEKPIVNRTPVTPAENLTPEETKGKTVEEDEPGFLATGETTPTPGEEMETSEPTGTTTATSSPTQTAPLGFTGETVAPDDNTTEEASIAESPQNTTSTPGSTRTEANTDSDDSDDEEPEVDTNPEATLERFASPRPGATMARAHYSHDHPLIQSDHQLVNPASSYTAGRNETGVPSLTAVPSDGLFVRGIGVLLDRTPEDVVLTRSGVEIANLDWLLDTAMLLGGRHPRVALEGETFTVIVTVEAKNVTVTKDDPAYVVLVPPPGETGIYEITRIRDPGPLLDGERGVWEFSVATRTGRLTLADLTLSEERLITNLTSNPDFFAFRAYALSGDQEIPSMGISDPVIAIPFGEGPGVVEAFPRLYALVGVEDSALRPSETMAGAWARGVDHDAIVAAAAGHLEVTNGLGKEDVIAIYDLEGEGKEKGQPASSSSIFDLIMGFFRDLFGRSG